jgi:hypothetical protein
MTLSIWVEKQYLLERCDKLSQTSFEETPDFYLIYLIRNYLFKNGFNLNDSNAIISGINIDLSALGSSYKSEKDYLIKLSEKVGIAIINAYSSYKEVFGKEAAILLVAKRISICIK